MKVKRDWNSTAVSIQFSVFRQIVGPENSGKLYRLMALFVALLVFAGCNSGKKQDDDGGGKSNKISKHDLKVVMYGNAELKSLIEGQWQSAGHEIELTVIDELDPDPEKQKAQISGQDVVIFPPSSLGDFVKREWIQPVDYRSLDNELLAVNDILRLQKRDLVQYDRDIWATAMGSPVFCLVYRQDVMDALGVDAPTTWEQYLTIAKRLADQTGKLKDKDGNVLPTKVLEPTAGKWASHLLMARTSSAVCQRGRRSIEFALTDANPLIGSPPFVKALENLKACQDAHPQEPATPNQIFESIAKGEAALAITWPTSSVEFEESISGLAVAPLPIWKERYDSMTKNWMTRDSEAEHPVLLGFDGRLASVVYGAINKESAEYFLAWIASPEIQQRVWSRSPNCSLSRISQVRKPYAWCGTNSPRQVADDYATFVRESNESGLAMMSTRIPAANEYLAVLAQQTSRALKGEVEAAAALKQAAKEWDAITDKIGRDDQAKAYRASSGLGN